MKYKGDLYGKVGNKYFKLRQNTDDIEQKDEEIERLQKALDLACRKLANKELHFKKDYYYICTIMYEDFLKQAEQEIKAEKGGE